MNQHGITGMVGNGLAEQLASMKAKNHWLTAPSFDLLTAAN